MGEDRIGVALATGDVSGALRAWQETYGAMMGNLTPGMPRYIFCLQVR